MTQKEFETRTKVNVNADEFDAINTVYMASDLDKDAFCKMWCKMNRTRVNNAKVNEIVKAREEARRNVLWGIVNRGYTSDELFKYACEFFKPYEMIVCECAGIEVRWNTLVNDIIFDANQYLFK